MNDATRERTWAGLWNVQGWSSGRQKECRLRGSLGRGVPADGSSAQGPCPQQRVATLQQLFPRLSPRRTCKLPISYLPSPRISFTSHQPVGTEKAAPCSEGTIPTPSQARLPEGSGEVEEEVHPHLALSLLPLPPSPCSLPSHFSPPVPNQEPNSASSDLMEEDTGGQEGCGQHHLKPWQKVPSGHYPWPLDCRSNQLQRANVFSHARTDFLLVIIL
jgi:hypothetical protein